MNFLLSQGHAPVVKMLVCVCVRNETTKVRPEMNSRRARLESTPSRLRRKEAIRNIDGINEISSDIYASFMRYFFRGRSRR